MPRRIIETFEQMETGGATAPALFPHLTQYYPPNTNGKVDTLSPYTRFIPLQQFSASNLNMDLSVSTRENRNILDTTNIKVIIGEQGLADIKKLELKLGKPLLAGVTKSRNEYLKSGSPCARIMGNVGYNRPSIEGAVEKYLTYDQPSHMQGDSRAVHTIEDLMHGFTIMNGQKFILRTYKGRIGNYSIAETKMENNTSVDKWHILAVVLSENYYYQKLHILKRGTIDMNKVVILVNKDLEATNFETPGLRTLYMARLRPLLRTSGITTFLVPRDFITDNCFVPNIKLKGNIKERKEQVEGIKRVFQNYVNTNEIKFDDKTIPTSTEGVMAYAPEEAVTLVQGIDEMAVDRLLASRVRTGRIAGTGMAEEEVDPWCLTRISNRDDNSIVVNMGREGIEMVRQTLEEVREVSAITPDRVGEPLPFSDETAMRQMAMENAHLYNQMVILERESSTPNSVDFGTRMAELQVRYNVANNELLRTIDSTTETALTESAPSMEELPQTSEEELPF